MAKFDQAHFKILKDISAFSSIKRYHGMLPAKLALFYDQSKVNKLIEDECVERIVISFPCGSETVMLALTERGHEMLEALLPEYEKAVARVSPAEEDDGSMQAQSGLSREQCILISDVYHYSNIHEYGGLMPYDILERYSSKDVNALSASGYLIHVKAEMGKGKKRKGVILTDKALSTLQAMNLAPMNAGFINPWRHPCR